MAHIQKISLLSKRLSVVLNRVRLNNTCQSQAWQKQEKTTLPAVQLFNFNLFNSSTSENIPQPIKQFCTLAKSDILEDKELKSETSISSPRSLSEIDLSSNDLINTFSALNKIFFNNKFYRTSTFKNELQQYISSEKFINFCNSLEQKLPMLSAEELKLLLQCILFGIPASSALTQKVYQLIIEKINEFSPTEVVSIYDILKYSQENDPKGKVLRLICEEYFASKVFNNIYDCKDYHQMAFLSKSENVPIEVRKKLLFVLSKHFKKIENELQLYPLSRMFGAFAVPSLQSYFKQEMYDALKARAPEKLSIIQICNILTGLKQLMVNKISYDEDYLNTLMEQSLKRKMNLAALTELIKLFLDLEFLPLPLIKRLEEIVAIPNFNFKNHAFASRTAAILSNAYYDPLGYTGDDSNHIEVIKKLESMPLDKERLGAYAQMCYLLTVLGSQNRIELLDSLFKLLMETYSSEVSRVAVPVSVIEAIIILHAFARRNFPNEVTELSETILKKFCYGLKTEGLKHVHQAMRKVLGSETSLEHCTTSMFHFIDLAVLLDEHNKPQKITLDSDDNSSTGLFNIENINRPPSSKLILYQLYRGDSSCQFKNNSNLPGTIQLYLQSFESLLKPDYKVVLFPGKKLMSLRKNQVFSYFEEKLFGSLQGT